MYDCSLLLDHVYLLPSSGKSIKSLTLMKLENYTMEREVKIPRFFSFEYLTILKSPPKIHGTCQRDLTLASKSKKSPLVWMKEKSCLGQWHSKNPRNCSIELHDTFLYITWKKKKKKKKQTSFPQFHKKNYFLWVGSGSEPLFKCHWNQTSSKKLLQSSP